jgi:hypothetical protein
MKPMSHPRSRLPTLGADLYFCAVIGAVSEAAIRHYIEAWNGAFVQIPALPHAALKLMFWARC